MSRVALYCEEPGSGLLACSRDAQRRGERVVSARCETEDAQAGRQELHDLVDRMLTGEFDAIVASLMTAHGCSTVTRLVRLSDVATPS